jgi:hypothetical protein
MALKPCRECGKEISDQAEACPHCGIKNPGHSGGASQQPLKSPPPVTPKKKGNGCLTVIGIFFIIVVGIVAIGSNSGGNSSPNISQNSAPQLSSSDAGNVSAPPSSPPAPTCSSDWHACKDNADLVNNSGVWGYVQSACQTAVDKDVQYGEPKWPGFMSGGSFGTFLTGNDYISAGIATAIEADVQVENAFGAMVHSTARCRYDLNSKMVIDVSVNPN